MKRTTVPTAISLLVALLFLFGCGDDLEKPDKALIVTGVEELGGATVTLDGVPLGSLETVEKPPEILIWVLSRITGNRGPYEDDHETVALIFDLEGTVPGAHLVVINHPDYQPIEKPFNYPENMVMNPEQPKSGVVFLACTEFDLIPASSAE